MSINKQLSLLIIILLMQLLNSCIETATDSPYPPIHFSKIKNMPGNGRASAVAFSVNGKGYIALGRDSLGVSQKDCWEYDPTKDTWEEKEKFPGIARVKAIAAVVNGNAYVGLGYDLNKTNGMDNGLGILKDFWMYEPKIDHWTQKASLPSKAADACVSFVVNNEIYVGAGFDGLGFTNECWKYNTLNNEWIRLKDFSGTHRAVAIACGDSAHIYFGTGYKTMSLNDWWEYEPTSDSWTQKKSMPDNGRGNAVAFTLNNRYFVSTGQHFGGDLTGGHLKSDIMEYNPKANVWYNRGSIPTSGRENAIIFTINGKGYIGIGENKSLALKDMWCFQP
jgi:N-acetylneuraminic acid mutarotase